MPEACGPACRLFPPLLAEEIRRFAADFSTSVERTCGDPSWLMLVVKSKQRFVIHQGGDVVLCSSSSIFNQVSGFHEEVCVTSASHLPELRAWRIKDHDTTPDRSWLGSLRAATPAKANSALPLPSPCLPQCGSPGKVRLNAELTTHWIGVRRTFTGRLENFYQFRHTTWRLFQLNRGKWRNARHAPVAICLSAVFMPIGEQTGQWARISR